MYCKLVNLICIAALTVRSKGTVICVSGLFIYDPPASTRPIDLKHRNNCESCPSQVTWKIKFKCQICLSSLFFLICKGFAWFNVDTFNLKYLLGRCLRYLGDKSTHDYWGLSKNSFCKVVSEFFKDIRWKASRNQVLSANTSYIIYMIWQEKNWKAMSLHFCCIVLHEFLGFWIKLWFSTLMIIY